MHKYTVEVVIQPEGSQEPIVLPLQGTTFYAVTAYQNPQVSLKMAMQESVAYSYY